MSLLFENVSFSYPGAQHGIEAPLRERAADDFGQGGEDRVLQLRDDEPHHARPPHP